MTTTTEFQLVDINKLVPYANNARTHNKEQILKLRSSLREFGVVSPMVIDKDYNVLCGHGRLEAAKAEGMTEIPCVFVEHMTEAQKKAFILADNRMALDAGWDDELLAVEMEELQNLGFDLGLTGFDEKELAACLILMAVMKSRMMILTLPQHLKRLHLYSVAISGQSENIS